MTINNSNKINIDLNFDEAVNMASEMFFNGSVFIYPTDTIYGFGGNPFNEDVVNRISKIKGRQEWKRYIHLIGSIEILQKYAEINSEKHLDFLISIWPNPVSVVLNVNKDTKGLLNTDTLAFRIPNNRFCLKFLNEIKMPLISTSVNRTGQEPMIEPDLIFQEFENDVDTIFYSENKSFFEASTLIDLSDKEPVLLREGRLKFKDLIKPSFG